MSEKIVYDPKEDAANQKNAAKNLSKAAKSTENPKSAKTQKDDKNVVDAKAHAEDGADVAPDKPEAEEEPVKSFKVKINDYGFLHIPKAAIPSLPFKPKQPLTARVEGDHLIIAAATEKA
jgi:hypothetical protein